MTEGALTCVDYALLAKAPPVLHLNGNNICTIFFKGRLFQNGKDQDFDYTHTWRHPSARLKLPLHPAYEIFAAHALKSSSPSLRGAYLEKKLHSFEGHVS